MIKKINEVRNIELINRVFEFLKTTPILKTLFKELEYDNYVLKDGIHKLLTLLKIIFKIIIKYLLYLAVIKSIFITFEDTDGAITFNQNSMILLFSITTVVFSITYHIINFDKNDYLMVKLLGIDRKEYVKNKILFFVFSELFYMTLVVLMMGYSFKTSLFMAFLNVSIKVLMERLYLFRIKKSRFQLLTGLVLRYVPSIIFYVIEMVSYVTIVAFYVDISLPNIVIYLPATIIILSAIYMVYYLIKKYDYNFLFNKYLTIEMYEISQTKLFAKSIDTEYVPRKSKIETKKKGFDYLYYLFNKRYAKSLLIKILFYGGILNLLYLVTWWNCHDDPELITEVRELISFIPFLGIMMTISVDYLKLCYSQLDSKLLKYNFYKTNIYAHMKYRFFGFIKYELLFCFLVYHPLFLLNPGIKSLINIIIYVVVGIMFNISINYYFYFFVESKNQDRIKLLTYCHIVKCLLLSVIMVNSSNPLIVFGILALISFVLIYLCYKNVKGELKK